MINMSNELGGLTQYLTFSRLYLRYFGLDIAGIKGRQALPATQDQNRLHSFWFFVPVTLLSFESYIHAKSLRSSDYEQVMRLLKSVLSR